LFVHFINLIILIDSLTIIQIECLLKLANEFNNTAGIFNCTAIYIAHYGEEWQRNDQ